MLRLKKARGLSTSIRDQGQSWSMWDICLCGGVMAGGKTPFIGFQSLPVGRNRASRAQIAMILLKETVSAWKRFPKDTVLLILALLTLPRSLKLFGAAAKTSHRDGSPSMQANIFVRKKPRFSLPTNDSDHVSTEFLCVKSSMIIPKLIVSEIYILLGLRTSSIIQLSKSTNTTP